MSPTSIRFGYFVAALLVAASLAVHATSVLRGGQPSWPMISNMTGLLIMMSLGALDIARSKLRLILSVIAITLVILSSIYILFGFGHICATAYCPKIQISHASDERLKS